MIACPRTCGRSFQNMAGLKGHLAWCGRGPYSADGTTKRCSACKEHRPVAEFRMRRPRPGRYAFRDAWCRECNNARRRVKERKPQGRTCSACGMHKALVAFRKASPEVCRACLARSGGRVVPPANPVVPFVPQNRTSSLHVRHSFAEWTALHRVTAGEHATIRAALARYGQSLPCCDEVIEAACAEQRYVQGGPPTRASVLRHAVVLLANEIAQATAGRITKIRTRAPHEQRTGKAA